MSLNTSLVAYYKMDGNSNDSIGSHNGTDTSVTYTNNTGGIILNGAIYNGTSAWTNIGTFASPISYSFWFKIPSITGSEMDLYSKWGNSHPNNLVLAIDATGLPTVFENNFAENFQGSTPVTPNVWHHFVYVNKIDGTNSVIYLDGVQVATTAGTTIGTDAFNAAIGAGGRGTAAWFAGDIDEVGMWSRVLTVAEIGKLYNSGAGFSFPFPSTMTAAVGTFTLTGYTANLVKSLFAAVGTFILTGFNSTFSTKISSMKNRAKHSSSITNRSKNSSSMTNRSKHSSVWTNRNKS